MGKATSFAPVTRSARKTTLCLATNDDGGSDSEEGESFSHSNGFRDIPLQEEQDLNGGTNVVSAVE